MTGDGRDFGIKPYPYKDSLLDNLEAALQSPERKLRLVASQTAMVVGDNPSPWPEIETLGELLDERPAPLDEIIPGRLERYLLCFLRAHGGSHKSRMVLQGGICAQAGHKFFGAQPAPGLSFVHVSGEDMRDEVIRRVHGIRNGLRLGDGADMARYVDACQVGQPLFIVEDVSGNPVTLTEFGKWLSRELRAMPGHKLVALDSFYNFVRFTGQAMANMELVRFVIQTSFGQFCRNTDSTVWTPWHPSYAGQGRDDQSGFNVAFHNAPRVADAITREKDSDVFTLKGVKRNNGALPLPVQFVYRDGALQVPSAAESEAREAPFRAACVEMAARMARCGQPVTKRNKVPREAQLIIEKMLGDPLARFTDKAVKDALLAAAAVDGTLVYIQSDPHHAAGYYPVGAEDLARRVYRRDQ